MGVKSCLFIFVSWWSSCVCVSISSFANRGGYKVDWQERPLCGDTPVYKQRNCYCGNVTLAGWMDLADGEFYCCVPSSEQQQCSEAGFKSDVWCPNGQVKNKREPCNNQCWNSYEDSEKLYKTATLNCLEENFCLPLDQMCTGVCKAEEVFCSQDLRCLGDGLKSTISFRPGNYTITSLSTKLAENHNYCLRVNNDVGYDTISRKDEVKILGDNERSVDYGGLVKCLDTSFAGDGIQCPGDKIKCLSQDYWCSGYGNVCSTGKDVVSADNPELCRNNTFWLKIDVSCDYAPGYRLYSAGIRCYGDMKQCIYPWYTKDYKNTNILGFSDGLPTTCLDNSDKVFPMNTSCHDYNKRFLEKFKNIWCSDDRKLGDRCDDVENDWYSNQDNGLIRDPHGCERSCVNQERDCLACHHNDYFNCTSTGVCIHKSNRCDGHPHPACGGDDESVYDCLQLYFKKRIVKSYATLICPSKMYPEMDTLAVVCDENIECAEDRDEKLCATGADKYNPIVYAFTAGTCMIYVILKLVWFFHQKHEPVGDEEDGDDENNMEMKEITPASNQDQEELEVRPSSDDSIKYRRALEQLDRVMEITKNMTGYVSSDDEPASE